MSWRFAFDLFSFFFLNGLLKLWEWAFIYSFDLERFLKTLSGFYHKTFLFIQHASLYWFANKLTVRPFASLDIVALTYYLHMMMMILSEAALQTICNSVLSVWTFLHTRVYCLRIFNFKLFLFFTVNFKIFVNNFF